MKQKNQKVEATPELLEEMDQLEILGGKGTDDITVYNLSNCKPNYSGNCVAGCACNPDTGGEKVDPFDPKPINPTNP